MLLDFALKKEKADGKGYLVLDAQQQKIAKNLQKSDILVNYPNFPLKSLPP